MGLLQDVIVKKKLIWLDILENKFTYEGYKQFAKLFKGSSFDLFFYSQRDNNDITAIQHASVIGHIINQSPELHVLELANLTRDPACFLMGVAS